MPQKISDVMTADPTSMNMNATIADAARTMREEGIGDVLVMRDGEVCGIVTDRDIVIRAIAAGKDPSSTQLKEVCSQKLVTVSPKDDVAEAIKMMRGKAIRRVPVVDKGKPVGIVSIGDLAEERDPDSALADISASPPNN